MSKAIKSKHQLLMGLTEVAKEFGKTKTNIRRDVINAGIGFPVPLARLHCGPIWLTAIVLEWKARVWDRTGKRKKQS